MTDTEILEWFQMLAPSHARRRRIVRVLLSFANTDRMSEEDRLICRRVLFGDLYQRTLLLPERKGIHAGAEAESREPQCERVRESADSTTDANTR